MLEEFSTKAGDQFAIRPRAIVTREAARSNLEFSFSIPGGRHFGFAEPRVTACGSEVIRGKRLQWPARSREQATARGRTWRGARLQGQSLALPDRAMRLYFWLGWRRIRPRLIRQFARVLHRRIES